MSTETPKRYHPIHVVLHWLIAIMTIFALLVGMFILSPAPNVPQKAGPLGFHAVWGIVLLVLSIVRLIVRYTLPRPAPASAGNAVLDWVGKAVHGLLYVGVLGMALSGLGIAVQARLIDVLRGNAPFPSDFMIYPPRLGHGLTSRILLGLIGLHIAAALYHQFIRKDNLLARMWFAKQ